MPLSPKVACCAVAAVLLVSPEPVGAQAQGPWSAPPPQTPPPAYLPTNQCACVPPGAPGALPGVVWRGRVPRMSLDDLAHLVAPILWFSSDEPLIVRGDLPIPRAMPCDRPSRAPVVYYEARRIQLRGDEEVSRPLERDPHFFAKVASVVIRFYFYYPEDIGFEGHIHDLEVAEFHVWLDESGGCGDVRIERVIGFAHGVQWYFNRLVVKADTRFPITLLVEEGKHASCPDRNADGVYTPGYDVNRWVNDAWGIRDVLGSGFLGAAPYDASMTKPRKYAYRLLPPPVRLTCVGRSNSSFAHSTEAMGVYELRPASGISASACERRPIPNEKELMSLMRGNKFGAEYPALQSQSVLKLNVSDPVTLARRFVPNVSLRYDQHIGVALVLAGFDLRLFYVAPKINWVGKERWSFEALFTNSAARVYSPYLTVGAGHEEIANVYQWRFVAETGLRFRYRLSGWQRILGLGYNFAGARFGLRMSGFDNVTDFRFVAEFGAGAW